jgi:hypothetical protein
MRRHAGKRTDLSFSDKALIDFSIFLNWDGGHKKSPTYRPEAYRMGLSDEAEGKPNVLGHKKSPTYRPEVYRMGLSDEAEGKPNVLGHKKSPAVEQPRP